MPRFSIATILKEARRRRVFRVAGLYIVGAWIVLQVSDLAFPALNIPEVSIRFVWIGLIIGLPIALVFGWRYDIIDGRLTRTQSSRHDVDLSLQQADYIVLAALIAVGALITIGTVGEISNTQTSIEDASWVEKVDPASIAVLPFANLSPDPNNVFFADGIAEELLNGLAKVRGLRVAGRTSSFSLREDDLDIRQIGERLRVAHVLEGSVRVAGETIRVTAQLIDSRTDAHLWSDTYDRPVGDVFAVQDDIAANIVHALREELDQVEPLQSVSSTNSTEAFSQYLRAKSILRLRQRTASDPLAEVNRSISLLEAAIGIDKGFSDAYTSLSEAYLMLERIYLPPGLVDKEAANHARLSANAAAAMAIELQPSNWKALITLAGMSANEQEQERLLRLALDENPNDASALRDLGDILNRTGRPEEGAQLARKALSVDPLDPLNSMVMAYVSTMEGRVKDASDYFQLSNSLQNSPQADPERVAEKRATIMTKPAFPSNLGFEEGSTGWWFNPGCKDDYEFRISDEPYIGVQSGYLSARDGASGYCPVLQGIRAGDYLGKYVRVSAKFRTGDLARNASLWINVSDAERIISFADMYPNYISGNQPWTEHSIRVYVPNDGLQVNFGILLRGSGELWMDDFRFEVSDIPDFE